MSSSIGESVPLPPPNSRPDKEPRKWGERFASYIGTTTFRSCSIAGMPTLGTLASNKGISWQKWISPRYTQSFLVVWGDANRTLLCSYELYGACGDVFLLLPQWQLGLKFFSWTLLKQPSLPKKSNYSKEKPHIFLCFFVWNWKMTAQVYWRSRPTGRCWCFLI